MSPGLLRKAHEGLLIADELLEWSRDALETLREPLQEGRLVLARAGRDDLIPCRFLLAAAANPCPCGHPSDLCLCPAAARRRYLARLSGALLDRIGICASIPEAPAHSGPTHVERLIERVQKTARFFEDHGGPPGNWSPQELETQLRTLDAQTPLGRMSYRARHQRARVAFTFAGWHGRSIPIREDFRLAEWFAPDWIYDNLSRTSRTSLWDPIARKDRAIS
jgi:magnesium chelatase family protein